MEDIIYRQMAAEQDQHWWFLARRHILARLIANLGLGHHVREAPERDTPMQAFSSVLEIGCGPGGNLPMLARFGPLCAVEMHDYALSMARQRAPSADIQRGWLPDHLPFAGRQFDLIGLFDVLEHVQDDQAALATVRARLAPGGIAILTVPAYAWLYGDHDRAHGHYRRYTAASLRQKAQAAGLQPVRIGYFNTLLFAPIAIARLLARLRRPGGRSTRNTNCAQKSHTTSASAPTSDGVKSDASLPPPWLNSLLMRIFAAEAAIIPRWFFPFGVSVLAVLRHPGARNP
ncbi:MULTISPECIES: class I SAM-dependent methyltransferase [Thiorhodovibrio]|uniref:class I SAM-dependent methyltransferase n=1 Tax=Thiorhodovibrio TaxID=61593 RepID=UPI001913B219|nr:MULTISPECIES: class I SAM-dependent methyltransferase [Thiorhodovibrio]MBK5969024.1 hypothetical protein [Thiorhodovibrio winogradskyi]WPL15095.1 putative S-adenosylmethionine-dependent methyltransferase [Thiorhodovibrio litoralis]